jgi:hypothetical protein
MAQGFTRRSAEIVGICAVRCAATSILREALAGLDGGGEERAQAQRTPSPATPRRPGRRRPFAAIRAATSPWWSSSPAAATAADAPAMEALLRRDPNLRVVLKDLPILGPNSVLASRALLAAQRQGRVQLHDALTAARRADRGGAAPAGGRVGLTRCAAT